DDTITWDTITIRRTDGHHGLGAVERLMGTVSGFILSAVGEPTVYIAGDTVLCDEVSTAIATYSPDVIVLNCGGATWDDPDTGKRVFILMDAAEAIKTASLEPDADLVAVHLEALDHCTVTRDALRAAADAAGVDAARLHIPADGEQITLL
ncbi:MAG: MBL fold metallo-hydrolase, partial [Chloroflexota bacterium]